MPAMTAVTWRCEASADLLVHSRVFTDTLSALTCEVVPIMHCESWPSVPSLLIMCNLRSTRAHMSETMTVKDVRCEGDRDVRCVDIFERFTFRKTPHNCLGGTIV